MGVIIVSGALSRDHVHLFVDIPPHVSVSEFVQRAKGRSSRRIQQEFEHIRKRYWGQRFWARGYFSVRQESWRILAGESPVQVRGSARLVASVAAWKVTTTAKRTQQSCGVWD